MTHPPHGGQRPQGSRRDCGRRRRQARTCGRVEYHQFGWYLGIEVFHRPLSAYRGKWFGQQGLELAILAHKPHHATHPSSVSRVWFGNSIREALARFPADLVHIEWLYAVTWKHSHELRRKLGIPVTVRGHSFDFTPERAREVADLEAVARVFLFPHFAERVPHPKVRPLTSCFPEGFGPGTPEHPPLVLRAVAGVPHKNIKQWLSIAAACPEIRFLLVMTRALPPDEDYPEQIRAQLPPNVELRINQQREDMIEIMQRASIYFTTGGSHHFGMPVSIAEALASGQWVLCPDVPGSREYIGQGGRVFRDSGDAVRALRSAVAFNADEWRLVRERGVKEAERFRAARVLSVLLEEWRSLVPNSAQ